MDDDEQGQVIWNFGQARHETNHSGLVKCPASWDWLQRMRIEWPRGRPGA